MLMTMKPHHAGISFSIIIFFLVTSLALFSQETSDIKAETDEMFKMPLEDLLNITLITAGHSDERIADIPASVVLITRDDIKTYGYKTLTEILENIPGLFAIDDYMDTGANFGVRGFWSGVANDNMIILVNNIQQVNDFHSNYQLNKIDVPVEAIDRIEVIRGPMSVIYGAGAFYGVINIVTNKSPISCALINASAGSDKSRKAFLRLSKDTLDYSFSINASITDSDGPNHPLSEMMTDPSILPKLGVPIDSTTEKKMENASKYFNLSGKFGNFSIKISFNEGKKEHYFNLPSPSEGTYNHHISQIFSFEYKKTLFKDFKFNGILTYSAMRDWYKYDHNVSQDEFYGMQELETQAVELELNTFYTPSENIDLKTGIYYRSVLNITDLYDLPSFHVPVLENTMLTLKKGDNIITQAVFTQLSFSPFSNFRLVAGIRLEQTPKYGIVRTHKVSGIPSESRSGTYDREKIELIPRLAAIFYLNNNHIFKFLFGQAINRPSFFQNTKNSLDPRRNPLDPEQIQTIELNYIAVINSNITMNISLFRNSLDNLITRVVKFNDQTKEYDSWSDNAGKLITHGMEVSINTEPAKNFRMELSAIYQSTEDKRVDFKNIDVAYSPNILCYFKASYKIDNIFMGFTGNYVGGMKAFWDKTLPDKDGVIRQGNRIGEKVDGYFNFSVNFRYENIFLNGLFLNLRCSNLFNAEIFYPTFTNNSWADKGTLGYGRSFLMSLGYEFL